MAYKKPKYDPLSFDRGTDWVSPYELEQRRRQEEIARKKDELAKKLAEDPFANVQGHTDTVTPPAPSYGERVAQTGRAALDQISNAGSVIANDIKGSLAQNKEVELQTQMSLAPEQLDAAQKQADSLRAQAQGSGDQFGMQMLNQANALQKRIDDAKMVQADPAGAAIALKQATAMRKLLTEQGAAANAALDKADPSHISSLLAGLVGHPEQLAPMAGGLVGGIAGGIDTAGVGAPVGAQIGAALTSGPMIKASYNEAFLRARDQGASFEEADKYANAQAKVMGAINIIGGGAFGMASRGAANIAVQNLGKHAVHRIAEGAATGYVFGAANEVGTLATDKALAAGNDKVAEIANNNLPSRAVEVFDRINKSGLSSAVAGAAITSPHVAFDVWREAGRDAGRIQKIRDRYADKPKYTDAVPQDLPGIPSASDYAGPQAGQAEVTRNPGPSSEDIARLRMLNDSIAVLQDRVDSGKYKTPDIQRLAFLKGARARMVGMDKPRMAGDKVVEPGLGLDYPAQPLNPTFTGLHDAAPVHDPNAPVIPAAAAEAATPVGGAGKSIPKGNNTKPGNTPVGKKAKEAKAAAGVTSADQLNAIRGRAQLSDTPTTGTTVEDVVNHITTGRAATRSTDQRTLTKLVHDRNLTIVPDESHVPAGAEKTGAGGFFDGHNTYIVADKLDKGNLMGDLLNIAAHEVHHAADASGKVTMRGFVGGKTVDGTISRIEAAAKLGDPIAKYAVDNATKANEANPGSYSDEVIPYAINKARDMRDKRSLGGRIMQDFTSAVRTAGKKFTGNADVNINDVAYLSDKLLQNAAIQGDRMTGKSAGRALIYGDQARGFKEADKAGITYPASDGKTKFVLSDAESQLKPKAVTTLRSSRKGLPLGELMNHSILFDQYPDAAKIHLEVSSDVPPEAWAQYDPADKSIQVSRGFLDGPQANELRPILLHEIQHWIQDRQGEHVNFFDRTNLPPKEAQAVDRFTTAEKLTQDTSRKVLDNAAPLLDKYISDPVSRREAMKTVMNNKLSDHNKAARLNRILMDEGAILSDRDHKLIQDFVTANQMYNESLPAYNAARDNFYNRYKGNITEGEAYFTQDNANVPDHKLPINPESSFSQQPIDVPHHLGSTPTDLAAIHERSLKPASAGRAGNLDGLKQHLEDNKQASDKIFKNAAHNMAKLFTPTGGRGDDINKIVAKAAGAQADLSGRIENTATRVKDAIRNAIKNDLGTEAEVVKALADATDKADGHADPAMRKSIIAALDRNYPGLGTAMNQLREMKLAFSNEIFDQRMKDPTPLTNKELAIYTKIHDQAEKYNTRAYLATIGGKVSEEYSHNLMKQFRLEPDSEQGKVVQRAIDFLIDKQLTIPSRDVLESYSTGDLTRMYSTWLGKTAKGRGESVRTKMIDELSNLPEKTAEEIHAKAIETIKSLLGTDKEETALAKYYRGGKQDRTILEARKNIPPEISALLGEIEHPIVKEMMSLIKMSALIHKTQSLIDVHDNLHGKEWSDTKSEEFPVHLSSDAYGPMDGKFVSTRLAEVLADSRMYSTSMDEELRGAMNDPSILAGKLLGVPLRVTRELSTWQKITSLVATPMALVYNFSGSWLMAVQNGVVNPLTWATSFRDTAETLYGGLTHRQSDSRLDMSSELRRAKVLDSATIGNLRGAANKDMFNMIRRLDPNDKGFRKSVRNIMQNSLIQRGFTGAKLAREMYALMDVWTKVAAYRDKKEYLTKFYEANGTPKTEDEIIHLAGYEVAQTNISYDMAIPIFRLLERNFSPVFMFATYTSECFRAHAQSYVQVFRDLERAQSATTPEARRMAQGAAMKRLAGTLAVTVGLNAMFMHILNGRSDEEKRQDKLDAPWEQNDIKIPLGTDKDGNKHYLGLSRFDPIGPDNELFRKVMMAKTPEEQHGAMKEAITQFFINSRSNFALLHVIGDIVAHAGGPTSWEKRDKHNTFLERNYPQTYQKLVNSLQAGDLGANTAELLDTLLPGILRPLVDPKVNEVVKVDKGDFPALGAAMSILGGKSYVLDPNKSMTFRVIDYTKGMKALKAEKAQFMDRQVTLSPDVILTKLSDLRKKEKALQADLADAYDGYRAFGKPQAVGLKVLHDARLTSIGLNNLKTGTMKSELMDTKALTAWYKKSMKEANTEEEKVSVRNKYQLLRKIYSQENTH